MKRFAMLYTRPGGYTAACVRKLKEKYGVHTLAITYASDSGRPYDVEPLAAVSEWEPVAGYRSSEQIADRITAFKPDAVYLSGWSDKWYFAAAKKLRGQGFPIISCMDNQYHEKIRQRLAILFAPYYLHRVIDILWVPGVIQAYYARRLGYSGKRCWMGHYCCDWEAFSSVKRVRSTETPCFLYVGRYVHAKALDVLAKAYKMYKKSASKPWRLVCVGSGPCRTELNGIEGLIDLGFIQPNDLPATMDQASAFILPSRHEPWGVVVQEAAAVGLPLICSDRVGAHPHLVQDYYNGFTFASGDANQLADVMTRMSALPEKSLREMGKRSRELSRQFLPERWADTLVNGLERYSGSDT